MNRNLKLSKKNEDITDLMKLIETHSITFPVINRSGQEREFDVQKLLIAVKLANEAQAVPISCRLKNYQIAAIINEVVNNVAEIPRSVNVEELQDMVEDAIMRINAFSVARAYIKYRQKRTDVRIKNTTDDAILSLIERENEEVKQENSNKNPTMNSVQRDYMAGEVSKDITRRYLLPEDISYAHDIGIIHFHDSDYFAQHMGNCCLVNLEDMLTNGTVISGTMIDPPKSFATACNIATQIISQVASSQYGGQSITLAHLAPFVEVSRKKLRAKVRKDLELEGILLDDATINRIAERRLRDEIEAGMQTIQYQVITLLTTNGQAPFITVFMYIDEVPEGQTRDDLVLMMEIMLKQRIRGVKNECGVYITPAFPKLIYVLDEDNIHEISKYRYLTELAAKCSAKRLVPDYISAKVMKEIKEGNVYPCMGCRSFLTVSPSYKNMDGSSKFYGRFNQGVVTLNLVDVALSSNGDEDEFWRLMDERLELCHRALRCRHERLLGTPSDVAPILWQHGALARLKKGEVIDSLLYNGYSTISLGYAGLYECTKYMTGKSHTNKDGGTDFAMKVMQALNDACNKWKEAENIDYSVYGTPLESTTYRFAKCLQKRFGIIPGITEKNYITNSYHVHVTEKIDAFTKLSFEAPFQKLSPGGAISYVEVPNLQENIDAVLTLIEYIYYNIMYAELNTKSDYCQCCGFSGEIKIVTDSNGKLIWECPQCNNRDQDKMNVARRTCGYIGTEYWNQGRTSEINDRELHI